MPGSTVKCTTPKTAALLSNNLAANGKHVGYAAYSSAVIVPDAAAVRGGSALSQTFTIEADDNAQIHQMRWVTLQMRELLVLATSVSVNIYSADGQRLLHVVTAANEHGLPASFRGIGSCVAGHCEYICVGVSTGAVCLVPIPDPEPNSVQFGDSLLSPT